MDAEFKVVSRAVAFIPSVDVFVRDSALGFTILLVSSFEESRSRHAKKSHPQATNAQGLVK